MCLDFLFKQKTASEMRMRDWSSDLCSSDLPDHKNVVKSDNVSQWWDDQADKLGLGTMLGMIGRNAMNGFSRDEMIVLGKRLAYSHVPSVYDWRSMLRLPVTLDQAVETIPNTAPSLHLGYIRPERSAVPSRNFGAVDRTEEHTSELQ